MFLPVFKPTNLNYFVPSFPVALCMLRRIAYKCVHFAKLFIVRIGVRLCHRGCFDEVALKAEPFAFGFPIFGLVEQSTTVNTVMCCFCSSEELIL